MTRIDESEILAALGLTKRSPDLRFLADLFEAFNRTVPFESASKIVRNAERDTLAEKPRTPDVFWRDHEELGAGGTCFARTAAFAGLTEDLGFSPVRILASIAAPESHAALLYGMEGRTWLVDPGYPLAEIRPLESGPFDSAFGSCVLEVGSERAILRFETGPERGRLIDYGLLPVPEDRFREAWERTFSTPSLFLGGVVLRRRVDDRVLRWFRAEVSISDAYSRTFVPVISARAARLSEVFSIDASLLQRAFAIAGDPDPVRRRARVEAYAETPSAERIFFELATPEGYRRFAAGIGDVEIEERGPGRFRAVLSGASGETVSEEIELDPDAGILRIRRSAGLTDSGFFLDRETGTPRLVRFADLPDAREEFLRSDMGRGRLAGLLAMDLLALSRQ